MCAGRRAVEPRRGSRTGGGAPDDRRDRSRALSAARQPRPGASRDVPGLERPEGASALRRRCRRFGRPHRIADRGPAPAVTLAVSGDSRRVPRDGRLADSRLPRSSDRRLRRSTRFDRRAPGRPESLRDHLSQHLRRRHAVLRAGHAGRWSHAIWLRLYAPEPVADAPGPPAGRLSVRSARRDGSVGGADGVCGAGPHSRSARRVLFLFTPRAFFVLEQGWIEPFVICGLCAVVFCAVRRPKALPYAVVLFLSTKQYLLFALPAILLLLPRPWPSAQGRCCAPGRRRS